MRAYLGPTSSKPTTNVAQQALVGPPDRIYQGLQEVRRKLGAERFVLFMEAIADRKIILSSIDRFAQEVMPRFASLSSADPRPASVA